MVKGEQIMKTMGVYKHIKNYKDYSIYQDMDDNYFVIVDADDNILYREATMALLLKSVP